MPSWYAKSRSPTSQTHAFITFPSFPSPFPFPRLFSRTGLYRFLGTSMAIRRLDRGSRFSRVSDPEGICFAGRSIASVSTLPTVKAMRDCFERYLNLTIADGNASSDTVKTYRNRVAQFLYWCKEKELYPALITRENIKEYRKHLVDGAKSCATIRLSLLAVKHFYVSCLAEKLVKEKW